MSSYIPSIPDLSEVGLAEKVDKLTSYIAILRRELEFALQTIDSENLSEVYSEHVLEVENQVIANANLVTTHDGNIATLTQTAAGLTSSVSSNTGNISTLTQTAASLTLDIDNTKVTVDTSGIEVKNGGITVKDENGTTAMYCNSYGDLVLRGALYAATGTFSGTVTWSGGSGTNRIYYGTPSAFTQSMTVIESPEIYLDASTVRCKSIVNIPYLQAATADIDELIVPIGGSIKIQQSDGTEKSGLTTTRLIDGKYYKFQNGILVTVI